MKVFVTLGHQPEVPYDNPATRPVRYTLEAAKAAIDAERQREGYAPLDWRDEFGGSTATGTVYLGRLTYDIVPEEMIP